VTNGTLSSTMSRLLHNRVSRSVIGRSKTVTAGKVVSKATCSEASAVCNPQLTSELDFCKTTRNKILRIPRTDKGPVMVNSLYTNIKLDTGKRLVHSSVKINTVNVVGF
jgi:hypothetical protein